ncbi:MAG TPA: prepilin-type N-terminal cleavage/methylation domain-containing protein [Patescibacteria group bacterium]|nr:prepilin-type N-terminal cleavage/methylation domain-containing protein [Patescibacteria group bacterium]
MNTRRGQSGDTLVEVLISIVIVSTVIGGAFVVSNKSLQSTRSTQERSNALKLSEAQIEQLRGLIASDPTQVFGAGVPTTFCMNSSSGVTKLYDAGTALLKQQNCVFDTSGAIAAANTQPAYTLVIKRTGNDFKLFEGWTDVSGHFSDSAQINYRAYQ